MLLIASQCSVRAQEITTPAPPPPTTLPDGPEQAQYPTAQTVLPVEDTTPVILESSTQAEQGGRYTLDGNVKITYKDRIIEADHIVYDRNTDEVTATGHLVVSGGSNQEHLTATRGVMNLRLESGRFYDVTGSVGMKPSTRGVVYTNGNPFLFTGRLVVRTGPTEYEVFDGTVTSCQLPHPDWLLSAAHISVAAGKAKARNSTFHLLNLPLLYLPYVTHPTDSEERQSGILIPIFGESSVKGIILGETIYVVLNRSTDMTVGAEYYSSRGFAQLGSFRYRGSGLNFITGHYSGLLDRRPPGITNQGGQDAVAAGRHDFGEYTRVAANVEYLSSYVFRQAFAESFNTAVTSDVVSTAYAVHQSNGMESAALFDRYQGIKLVQQGTSPGQQVRIFHAPSLSFDAADHRIASTGFEWSFESSAAGLKRTQPNFATGGIVERLDLHPELAYPLTFGGWHARPSIAVRETVYTRSRVAATGAAQAPQESQSGVSRSDFEGQLEVRPPVVQRTFTAGLLPRLFGGPVRHVIEPEVTYRYVTGVDTFNNLLRFDAVDVVSNTDELEYGVTQRLFSRPSKPKACDYAPASQDFGLGGSESSPGTAQNNGQTSTQDNPSPAYKPQSKDPGTPCGNHELLSWRLTQKYFFDQTFGNAVVNGRRNIFSTTLGLSGVAFLTEPRAISPLISRLRLHTSSHTDLEWDFDLDTGAKKFTSSNVYADLHQGNRFGALSYARLDAPGRFYTEGTSSLVSKFSQLRLLLGYGLPTKPGLSLAGNAGLDLRAGTSTTLPAASTSASGTTATQSLLQYASLQASYNWNCCGFNIEYRKYELGSVRNEGAYRFNFTLANIGSAGNLRRAERLF